MEKLMENQSTETGAEKADKSRKFNLKFGYQDKENPEIFHREVVISRRPNGADRMKSWEESGGSDLQASLAIAQTAISKFGAMEMPCPLTVLLSLNEIDREKLWREFLDFLSETSVDGEILEDGKVRLGTGFKRGSRKIIDLKFGKLLTSYDEIEIENDAKNFWHAVALRTIKRIESPNDITVAEIESLDVNDFNLLQTAEVQWLNSFRGD